MHQECSRASLISQKMVVAGEIHYRVTVHPSTRVCMTANISIFHWIVHVQTLLQVYALKYLFKKKGCKTSWLSWSQQNRLQIQSWIISNVRSQDVGTLGNEYVVETHKSRN